MKKVYVATYFDWFSFGAVLQSVAMNKFLEKLGYQSYLIDYKQQDIKSKKIKGLRKKIGKIIFCYDDIKRKHNTEKFIINNVNMTKHYTKFNDLRELDGNDSVFLAGSDQVWHPDLCSDFFFLRFTSPLKRISYAASMGKTNISAKDYEKYKLYINEMKHISVREKSAANLIKNLTDTSVVVNIDPTFLLPIDFWISKERKYQIHKPYVLVFPIYWHEKYNDLLKEYHHRTGVEIVVLSKSFNVYCNRRINDADPGQFLYLIHHAQNVISTSFHGTVFSMLYKKNFRAFINPTLPSRIDDLLSMFNMEKFGEPIEKLDFPEVNYSGFDQVVLEQRKIAQVYLEEAIGND